MGYDVPRWSLVDGAEPVTDVPNGYEDTGELEVDGCLGVQSVTAWRRALDTYVGGVVSGQLWECWGNTPRLVTVRRVATPYGSQLVSEIQMVVGADVYDLMAPKRCDACRCGSTHMGVTVAGSTAFWG